MTQKQVTLFVNSLGHGGSERQAAFIGEGLLARGWDVAVLCVLERDDYASPQLAERTVVLGKRGRADWFRMVSSASQHLDRARLTLCFNWYPHAVASLARPEAPRVVRYGGIPQQDGVVGLKRVLARRAQRSARAVIGCSWGVTRSAVEYLGPPAQLCAAIPNAVFGLDVADSGLDSPWPRPYLLSVGRLSAEKGHETAIRAFAQVAEKIPHDLLIAGDGTAEAQLRSLISLLDLRERVHLIGYRGDLERWLAHATLLVHTPKWEGFGIVLIEAMRAGLPVVVTDAPFGPGDVIARVPGGVLVPVGDVHAVADQIIRLVDDPGERARLGEIGARMVPTAFSPDASIDAYERLLSTVGCL